MRDRPHFRKTVMRLTAGLLFASTVATAAPAGHLSVRSNTFRNNSFLPMTAAYNAHGCTGLNQSPELHWSDAPRGTKSFALIMHDPDAKAPGGWYHWVLYDMSSRVQELAAGANVSAARSGITSSRERKYGGPCPPPGSGVHHYVFTIYALKAIHFMRGRIDGPAIERVSSEVVQKATITGLYRR